MAEVILELGSRGRLSDGRNRSFADHGPLGDGKTPPQETLSHTHPLFCFFNLNLVSLILEGECRVLGKLSRVSNIHFLRVLHRHSFEQDGSCYVG